MVPNVFDPLKFYCIYFSFQSPRKLIQHTSSMDKDPIMPPYLLALYYVVSAVAFILCSLSFVAISRTKKTPYSTKLLSMGLLSFDIIFLVLACVSKLFNYQDVVVVWHTTRGFQIAAQILVGSMALERLFIINWPYVYLRTATIKLTQRICFGIYLFSILQYFVVRGLACYARKKVFGCGIPFFTYYFAISFLIPTVSLISYGKIYRIIRNKKGKKLHRYKLKQYKGTVSSFLVLINCTVTQTLCLILSVLNVLRFNSGVNGSGSTATLADCVNLINCIVDPLIYVIWFKETRMEILKLIQVVCPLVKPKVQKMRHEIFLISMTSYYEERKHLATKNRHMDTGKEI